MTSSFDSEQVDTEPPEPSGNGSAGEDAVASSRDGFTSGQLAIDAGVLSRLLGLSTGRDDACPQPSRRALELLLAPAVNVTVSLLLDHARQCRHPPSSCPHLPPPLRQFSKMRREALDSHRDGIARTLLQYPNHDFTRQAREGFLQIEEGETDHPSFVDAIDSGAIYTRDGFEQLLGAEPQRQAQRLGTLLWARGLEEPGEREFFELLHLVAHEPPEAPQEPEPAPAAAPRRRDLRRAKKEQQERIKALEDEISNLKRDRRRQAEALRVAEEAHAADHTGLAAAEATNEELAERVGSLERDLRLLRAELQTANAELAGARKNVTAARKLASDAQAEREAIEQARSLAVRALAIRRREKEILEAQLKAIPTGKYAVHAFLEEEERRIDTARTIAQGADRQRADEEHARREKLEDAFRAAYPEFVPPRPILRTEPASLQLTPIGGADEIGRSSYFLDIGGYSILVDCGIKVGRDDLDEIAPKIDRIAHLDAVVLTHAHTDHLGWLPALIRQFPEVLIYCTRETSELVPIMLDDCQRHHFAMMHRLKERTAYSSVVADVLDPYEPEDVRAVEDALDSLSFGEVVNLPGSDLRLTFFQAGHVLGAASALIEGEGRRVLMGGDISNETQLTVGAADWSAVGEVDLLVLESTYGDRARTPLDEQHRELVEFVAQAVARGGSVILPCFGLGRGQEVALLIARAMERGELPRVSIWIDGMIRKINRVYERHRPDFSLPRENCFEVQSVYDRFAAIEEAQRQPTVIVTTSGMLAGGPAVEYARTLLPDPRNRIAFTGYQDEGNPGHALITLTRDGAGAPRRVHVLNEEGESIEIVAAAPAALFRLSAHADQAGLVASALQVRPRHIVLVHGDHERQRALSERLLSEVRGTTVDLGSLRTFDIA